MSEAAWLTLMIAAAIIGYVFGFLCGRDFK